MASWDISGDPDPASWSYRLTLGGPSRLTTLSPCAGRGHGPYQAASRRRTALACISPLASAAIAGRLSAETMQALSDEVSGPRGFLLPSPVDGADPTVSALKSDIRSLRGKVALVEVHLKRLGWRWRATETKSEIGNREDSARRRDRRWSSKPSLPAREVYAACGVPLSVVTASEGTGQREGSGACFIQRSCRSPKSSARN